MPHDIIDEPTAAQVASLFEALSDPTRVRILSALVDGETNVGDLVQRIGLTKSAISHQLRGLKDKRLIRSRKAGRHVYVSIDDEHVTDLFQRGLEHALESN